MPIPLPGEVYYCAPDDVRTLKPNLLTTDLVSDDEMTAHCRNATATINSALWERYVVPFTSDIDDAIRTIAIYLAAADAVLSVPALRGYSSWAEGIRKQGMDWLERIRKGEYGIEAEVRTDPPSTGGTVKVLQTGEDRTPIFDRDSELDWRTPAEDMEEPALGDESLWGD